jgi:hypothetical protein
MQVGDVAVIANTYQVILELQAGCDEGSIVVTL